MDLLFYCYAEFAGFSVSEVHCQPDAAWSHHQVSAPRTQEKEEAPQHQCPVPGNAAFWQYERVKMKAVQRIQQQQQQQQQSWPFIKHLFCFLPQTSLTKLLETLNRAEPFFIRCIRSNAEKVRRCHCCCHCSCNFFLFKSLVSFWILTYTLPA